MERRGRGGKGRKKGNRREKEGERSLCVTISREGGLGTTTTSVLTVVSVTMDSSTWSQSSSSSIRSALILSLYRTWISSQVLRSRFKSTISWAYRLPLYIEDK